MKDIVVVLLVLAGGYFLLKQIRLMQQPPKPTIGSGISQMFGGLGTTIGVVADQAMGPTALFTRPLPLTTIAHIADVDLL